MYRQLNAFDGANLEKTVKLAHHRSIDSLKGRHHHHEIVDLKRELISNPMRFALTLEQEVWCMHVSVHPQAAHPCSVVACTLFVLFYVFPHVLWP